MVQCLPYNCRFPRDGDQALEKGVSEVIRREHVAAVRIHNHRVKGQFFGGRSSHLVCEIHDNCV
jgi:hypothetical protein